MKLTRLVLPLALAAIAGCSSTRAPDSTATAAATPAQRSTPAAQSTVRMEAISYGQEKPAETGHDEAGRAKNRRAELNYLAR